MKTYQIKDLLKKELLIIELPENVKIYHDEDDEGNHIGYSLTKFGQDSVEPFGLIDGYTLLGKPDEIREEDAKELVENKGSYYKNYSPIHGSVQGNITFTALESLLSAIESVIYWDVNPISKPDYFTTENSHIHVSTWSDFMQEWHEAELRTFDRNRSIILVKN